MHELSVAKKLFNLILEKAKQNSINEVKKIKIELGVASGVEKELLKHSLSEHYFRNTIAENAEIEFIIKPIVIQCNTCSSRLSMDDTPSLACSKCGGMSFEILGGTEIDVNSVEGM